MDEWPEADALDDSTDAESPPLHRSRLAGHGPSFFLAMFGVDELIAGLTKDQSPVVVLLAAVLLGLRHASDPDHLVAVSTLVASERERARRAAATLGLSWGIGHATTVVACGIPVVLFHRFLPSPVQRTAELLVGLVITALAFRLIRRWRRGALHAHEHAHGAIAHRHLHRHDRSRTHDHEHVLVRSPAQAYTVGVIHGVGGSAAVGLLLLASISDRLEGIIALLLFALGTAASMSVLSSVLGHVLAAAPGRRTFVRIAPALGLLSLAFGAWYTLGAVG